MSMTIFRRQLQRLIGMNNMETGSNTPDYVLARYLTECLVAFDRATLDRAKYYGSEPMYEPKPLGVEDEQHSES